MARRAVFGLIGLGTMGRNLALNLEDHGRSVAVWDREPEVTDAFVAERPDRDFTPTHDLEGLVGAVERPRRILLMVTAGPPVDEVLDRLTPLLEPGDVVVDGGNSWFEDTQRRHDELAGDGLHFVGMGVSGGAEGARRGPSLMPGGSVEAWELLKPTLEAIAARTDAGPCVAHVGPAGAGHLVKTVHNGIEYAEMQALAEAYDLLSGGLGLTAAELAELFAAWNEGPLASYLVELSSDIFRTRDAETGRPLLELVADRAGQGGTGRWTARVAIEAGVAVPNVVAAVDARVVSSQADLRRRAAHVLGAGFRRFEIADRAQVLSDVEQAVLGARLTTWAQGMGLIAALSARHAWNVDLAEIARTWKGGCIIRAAVIDDFRSAWEREPGLPLLVLDPGVAGRLASSEGPWRRIVAAAAELGFAVPVLSAGLAWLDMVRRDRLPQSLVQAQRDAFGAHGFERTDRPGRHHANWS